MLPLASELAVCMSYRVEVIYICESVFNGHLRCVGDDCQSLSIMQLASLVLQ